MKVTKAAPGIFYVSDMMGGYYDQKAGYGSSYAMTGYFQLLADNSLVLLSSSVEGWGDSATGFKDGKYDPATGEISLRSELCQYNGLYHLIEVIKQLRF